MISDSFISLFNQIILSGLFCSLPFMRGLVILIRINDKQNQVMNTTIKTLTSEFIILAIRTTLRCQLDYVSTDYFISMIVNKIDIKTQCYNTSFHQIGY